VLGDEDERLYGRLHGTAATASDAPPLRIHYLGPEKELFLLPLWAEVAALLPAAKLEVEMIGPVACELPTHPKRFDGAGGGYVTITARRGAYHALAREGEVRPDADLVIGLNAGLAASGYNWGPTIELIQRRGVPLCITDYSEYSAERAAAFAVKHGMKLSLPVTLNPFRAPLRQPLVGGGTVRFPWISNGFLAGLNLPPSYVRPPPPPS